MYLGPPCYGYALNYHLVYLAIPKKRPLCMKSKLCCFVYIKSQKVKFKFVQINMKHVSYGQDLHEMHTHLRSLKSLLTLYQIINKA